MEEKLVEMLQREVVAAQGCTEPIAVRENKPDIPAPKDGKAFLLHREDILTADIYFAKGRRI